ncbi:MULTISPECIES: methyl-accepting chemotaxis protein [unclassified Massilia]|uniref:methyl-accepting chemotaxis protein n=1 Tax=unclassified Massilia TaxID=2609279 RepID=UPI001B83A398|nr:MULTISPECIES: methyl-accepting chemotaxis protein [unclassified Massilia]MBQ5941848.1 MCP four helix bundle domain-containing protein [Massilia sp. AB1]MBQ5965748.1 MCP four helix bundle domain-containing protein [Massilia sp. ZL223]
MLNNLTIRSRLVFLTGFLSFQLVVGAVIGLVSLGMANDAMRSIYADRLVPLGQLDRIIRLLNINQMDVAKSIVADPAAAGRNLDEIEANIQTISRTWEAYMGTYLTDEERRLAEQFRQHRSRFVDEGLQPAVAALRAGDTQLATAIMNGKMTDLFVPVRRSIDALIELQLKVAHSEYETSQTLYRYVFISCIAGVVFGVVLALGLGLWITRSISRPLDAAVRIAGSVAAGDLSQRIEVGSANEIGQLMQALKDMNGGLADIVSRVRTGADSMATASNQIAAGNQDLSSRTEEQASSLEETAASMEELTSTVRQNADNAKHASQLAASASGIALQGGEVVARVVHTMDGISASSRKIGDIIAVIDSIAFQTNILALNAAVEAARAGEQGRGFAVVASEVRNLAQRSASAAREIKSLIEHSAEQVDAGGRLVAQAGATMQEIVDSVRRVTDIMAEISAASQEQSAGIEQVNRAIAQMDQVTQQNAALVEEAAGAAESLQSQAAGLSQVVSVFQLHAAPGRQEVLAAPRSGQPARLAMGGAAPDAWPR